MITQEILEMLFDELSEELEMDFATWVKTYGYTPDMSDYDIYQHLPDAIKDMLAEMGIHSSWNHGGM